MNFSAEHTTVPSLLWPPQHNRGSRSQGISAQQAQDLGLQVLVRALDYDGGHAQYVRGVLMALVNDADVIRYRQAVVAELSANEQLRSALAALEPQLAEFARPRIAAWASESPLLQIPPILSELELYVTCVEDLYAALSSVADLQSAALRELRVYTSALHADPEFQALAAELPALRDQLDQVKSVTIGLNLDRDLRPASAALVAINCEPFVGPRSLAGRLLGRAQAAGLPATTALRDVSSRTGENELLARDLQQALLEVVEPVGAALQKYHRVRARPLAALGLELAFYLGAVQMQQRLAAQGLPTCLPTVKAGDHTLQDAYNPGLALQLAAPTTNGKVPAVLVRNPIDFDPGRIVFLTGPNRGGKTTYLRAAGLNQILFQAGIFVAAADAYMTPVDAILTHFPPMEGVEPGGGRLDDEARRVREIFDHATSSSLLLFNEPLTSTAEGEALLLANDVVRALRLLGARTIFVTHLHALAEQIDALNRACEGATVASWVAEAHHGAPTYIVRPGMPQSRSHAHRIAVQHGITFDQLVQRLGAKIQSTDSAAGVADNEP